MDLLFKRVEQGRRADEIKSDPIFEQVVEAAKDEAWKAFTDSQYDDMEALRRARSMVDGLNAILRHLDRIAADGKMAAAQIKDESA